MVGNVDNIEPHGKQTVPSAEEDDHWDGEIDLDAQAMAYESHRELEKAVAEDCAKYGWEFEAD